MAPRHPAILGGPTARLRRWLWLHVGRYDGELCQFCGGRYDSTIWWAPAWMWRAVAAGRPLGMSCPGCFGAEAERLGVVLIGWRPMALTEWDEYVAAEIKEAQTAWRR